jgi:hypothetical protein
MALSSCHADRSASVTPKSAPEPCTNGTLTFEPIVKRTVLTAVSDRFTQLRKGPLVPTPTLKHVRDIRADVISDTGDDPANAPAIYAAFADKAGIDTTVFPIGTTWGSDTDNGTIDDLSPGTFVIYEGARIKTAHYTFACGGVTETGSVVGLWARNDGIIDCPPASIPKDDPEATDAIALSCTE